MNPIYLAFICVGYNADCGIKLCARKKCHALKMQFWFPLVTARLTWEMFVSYLVILRHGTFYFHIG